MPKASVVRGTWRITDRCEVRDPTAVASREVEAQENGSHGKDGDMSATPR
jgi:hypothetical protein